MNMQRTPKLLVDLIRHARNISERRNEHDSAESFLKNPASMESVLYNFVVLGEIARRLGEPFHDEHPDLPWRAIIAQRDVIAHGYDVIDWPQLLLTIEKNIPPLIENAERILDQYGPPPTV